MTMLRPGVNHSLWLFSMAEVLVGQIPTFVTNLQCCTGETKKYLGLGKGMLPVQLGDGIVSIPSPLNKSWWHYIMPYTTSLHSQLCTCMFKWSKDNWEEHRGRCILGGDAKWLKDEKRLMSDEQVNDESQNLKKRIEKTKCEIKIIAN